MWTFWRAIILPTTKPRPVLSHEPSCNVSDCLKHLPSFQILAQKSPPLWSLPRFTQENLCPHMHAPQFAHVSFGQSSCHNTLFSTQVAEFQLSNHIQRNAGKTAKISKLSQYPYWTCVSRQDHQISGGVIPSQGSSCSPSPPPQLSLRTSHQTALTSPPIPHLLTAWTDLASVRVLLHLPLGLSCSPAQGWELPGEAALLAGWWGWEADRAKTAFLSPDCGRAREAGNVCPKTHRFHRPSLRRGCALLCRVSLSLWEIPVPLWNVWCMEGAQQWLYRGSGNTTWGKGTVNPGAGRALLSLREAWARVGIRWNRCWQGIILHEVSQCPQDHSGAKRIGDQQL